MKKIIFTLGLVAVLGSTVVSCSTDDSALEQETKANGFGSGPIDNGDRDLPKPPIRA
jgi:hypothetical protein